MDEIAGQLGVSKKTIYQFFTDKDALVEAVMLAEMVHMQSNCCRQLKESDNAVDELFQDMDALEAVTAAMNPQILFDLEKFYPDTFEKFKSHKNNFLLDVIKANLRRGIQEEFFRADIDIDILAKFRLESAFISFNQELFPYGKYSLMKVSSEIYFHYMYGISTPKGKKLIEKYIQERQKNKLLAV